MFTVRTYNAIAPAGLVRLPDQRYHLTDDADDPHAILVRSHDLRQVEIPDSVLAIGRAGAGVNNIPVGQTTDRGVPVFNAPGANANAVKELVIGGMLLASRNLCAAWDHVRSLTAEGRELSSAVEAGKKRFLGRELAGRVLGVIGLGAIGGRVANVARELGMTVVGYDPKLTVRHAWELSAEIEPAADLDEVFARAEFVTLHVPLNDATRGIVDAKAIARLTPGAVILNFARAGIVDDAAALDGLRSGRLSTYVTDFPSRELLDHPRVIALPHLGASTVQAEENCAVMVVDQVRQYLEHGVLRNSVNFPSAELPRHGPHRVTISHRNIPNLVGQISSRLDADDINIEGVLNRSRGDLAYTILDVDHGIEGATADALRRIDGALRVRVLDQAAR